MKHIYKIIVLTICSLFFVSSCNLDRYPGNYFTDEELEKDPEVAFKYLLNGCYSQLKGWSDVMHRIGEYPGDNISIRGSSTDAFFPFISYAHLEENYRLYTFWENSYRAIIQANDAMALSPEGVSHEIDHSLGEAYYIRGMLYFYLTRAFGRPYYQDAKTNLGVPIILNGSPKKDEDIYAPNRSTVEQCYARAIEDLTKAETLMAKAAKEGNIKKSNVYASAEAAQAMLSRVYLYMSGTYENPNPEYLQKSIDYSELVINSGKYVLLSRDRFMKYNEFAPNNVTQTETVFAVKRVASEFTGSDHNGGIGGMYATILGQGWGEMYASAKYMDLLKKAGYHKEDARWAFIDPQYAENSKKEKTESFRFITDLYNKDTGALTGCSYVQDTLLTKTDGSYYIVLKSTGKDDKVVRTNYDITPYQPANNLYTIKYEGKTYIGEKDYMMLTNNGHPMFYIIKCSLQEGVSHLHSPIISRLAELHLNLAEAYAKQGKYEKALAQVNIIRGRSIIGGEYTSMDASNAKQLIDEERQLELAFEASRGYDIYRNGETLTRFYPGAHNQMLQVAATNNRVVHYIPKREIDAYPGTLTQNPK